MYQIPPPPPDPKHDMIDCTDKPDIIAACEQTEYTQAHDPRGGWYGGRFLVYADSLRQYREYLSATE